MSPGSFPDYQASVTAYEDQNTDQTHSISTYSTQNYSKPRSMKDSQYNDALTSCRVPNPVSQNGFRINPEDESLAKTKVHRGSNPSALLKKPLEDEYDTFGRHIANQLRNLQSQHQKIHAKKLISDVLYEAELECLSRGAKLITEKAIKNEKDTEQDIKS